MNRLSISTKLLVIFALFFALSIPTTSAFSDVSETDPRFPAISWMQQNGYINGFEDGTFRPSEKINRAAAAKILLKGEAPEVTSSPFSDAPIGEWFTNFIVEANNRGIMKGSNGLSRPADDLTLAEFLVMSLRANGIDSGICASQKLPEGVENAQWFSNPVRCAVMFGILGPNQKVNPAVAMTRGNVALVHKVITEAKSKLADYQALSEAKAQEEADYTAFLTSVEVLLTNALEQLKSGGVTGAVSPADQAVALTQEKKKETESQLVLSMAKISYATRQVIEAERILANGDPKKATQVLAEAMTTAKQATDLSGGNAIIANRIKALAEYVAKRSGSAGNINTATATNIQDKLTLTEQKIIEAIQFVQQKEIDKALASIYDSVSTSQEAKKLLPDNKIVLGAATVAWAVKEIIEGLDAGLKGNLDEAEVKAQSAIATAEKVKQIEGIDKGVYQIADVVINKFAASLLSDIENAKNK